MRKYLYRFRECNDKNFDALKNAKIWCTPANQFSDPRDCSIKVNACNNTNEAREMLKHIGIREILFGSVDSYLSTKFKINLTDDEINSILDHVNYDKEELDGDFTEFNNIVPTKEIEIAIKLGGYMFNYFLTDDEMLQVLLRSLQSRSVKKAEEWRRRFTVCCFTETYKNDAMWESFADGFKGFCCRYDMSRLEIIGKSPFKKVIYGEKPIFNFTNFYWINRKEKISEIQGEVCNQLIFKDKSMSYQREWRLLQEYPCPQEKGDLIDFDICDAIILGLKVIDKNKANLIKIAKEKKLKVFEQKLSSFGNYYYSPKIL